MAYTKEPKPKMVEYLKRQQNDYILLQNGGKIILRRLWSELAKPIAVYTKEAKPAIP